MTKIANAVLWSKRVVTLLLLPWLGACESSAPADDVAGTETNWLSECTTNDDCEVGSCVCGRCTFECASDTDCAGAPRPSRCSKSGEPEHPAACGADVSGVCLAEEEEPTTHDEASTEDDATASDAETNSPAGLDAALPVDVTGSGSEPDPSGAADAAVSPMLSSPDDATGPSVVSDSGAADVPSDDDAMNARCDACAATPLDGGSGASSSSAGSEDTSDAGSTGGIGEACSAFAGDERFAYWNYACPAPGGAPDVDREGVQCVNTAVAGSPEPMSFCDPVKCADPSGFICASCGGPGEACCHNTDCADQGCCLAGEVDPVNVCFAADECAACGAPGQPCCANRSCTPNANCIGDGESAQCVPLQTPGATP